MIRRIFLLLALLASAAPVCAAPMPSRTLTIAVGTDSVPYYYLNNENLPQGFLVDLWRLWANKTGIKIRFAPVDFAESLAMVRDGKAQVHAGCFRSPARQKYLDFVTPVCQVATTFFVHRNVYGIENLRDLRGLRIGVIKGDYALEYLEAMLPGASLDVYANNKTLFDAVEKGDVLAFVKDAAIGLAILSQRNLLRNFRYDLQRPLYSKPWYAAVKKGATGLPDLIRRGFAKITPEERAELELRWMNASSVKVADRLIITGPKDFAPFCMVSRSGRPAGMWVDIWRLWAQKTDRKVDFRFSDWPETMEDVRRDKADIHCGLFDAPEVRAGLDMSAPFYRIQSRFFINPRLIQASGPEDLKGRMVGVVRGSFQERYLRERYPDIKVTAFDDLDAVIQAALTGQVTAFLAAAPHALAALDHYGERGAFRPLGDPAISNAVMAGVRKGNAELLALIQAGFKAISERELAEIERNWISAPELRHFAPPRRELVLSKADKAWLAAHKVVILGGEADWPPLDYADAWGMHQGVSADYLRLLGKRLGIRFEVVTSFPWAEMLKKVEAREMAGVVAIAKSSEREKYLVFTKPYFSCPYMVFTRREHPRLRGFQDLQGKTVAVERGFYLQGELERRFPKIKLLLTKDTLSALKAVAEKKADAYLGNLMAANYLLRRENIPNLKVAGTSPVAASQLRLAVRKDWSILASLLDRALDTITAEEQNEINQRWSGPESAAVEEAGLLPLTPREREWLEEHRRIRLGVDPGWPPFEFLRDGKYYAGMASDYIRLLEQRLGVVMRPEPGLTWEQALAQGKAGDLDVFPCVARTPQRAKFLNFTKPYLSFPMVIVTRLDAPFIAGLQDLSGKLVAVGKGYASHELLAAGHPDLKLAPMDSIQEGLTRLSQGKLDAFVGNLGSITYFAREAGLSNIKIAASTPYSFSLSLGVRKDWPELVGILEKGMASISQRQRNEIHNAWVSMRFEHGVDWPYVWRLVAVIVAVSLAVFGIFIFWNTRLQREVRQRKEAEGALVKSEAHMRSLVEGSADAIVDLGLDRTILDCNPAFSRLFGYTRQEAVNQSVAIIHTSREAFEEMGRMSYPEVHRTGSWRGEWIYRSKSGREAPMETTISAYRHSDGKIAGFIAIVRDISERKRAEEALLNSRRRLAEIIDFLPDATLVIDQEGHVVAWNRAMEQLTGVKADEMLGRGDHAYSLPFYGRERPMLIDLARHWDESAAANYLSIKKSGESLVAESFQPRLGSNGMYLSVVARVLYDSAGREAGAIESLRNITDQKLAELALEKAAQELEQKVAERTAELQSAIEALRDEIAERQEIERILRKSEEEHRAVLEASPNCVIAYDTQGRAIYVNPAFTRIFGWTPEEVIGSVIDFVPEANRPETLEAIQKVYQEGRGLYAYESRRLTKSGEVIDVSLSAAAFRDPSGEPIGLIVNLADITERKRNEEELRLYREELERLVEERTAELEVAVNRAQEADRLKSAFLAAMSHELRTPLNSIIGFTGIILQGLVGPLNDEQAKQMGMVKRSAAHLLSLINDVLDISKIEAGQLTVDSEEVDLPQVIAEVEQTLRPAAQEKGLELICRVEPGVGVIVSDRRRVEQILINLINNAIKFTEKGGVYLDCRVEDGQVEIAVRDTGIGIELQDQGNLFKAFQQIDTGLTRRFEGTGLGLNICKKLTELLGGRIWMRSPGTGQGSSFYFTLPLKGGVPNE